MSGYIIQLYADSQRRTHVDLHAGYQVANDLILIRTQYKGQCDDTQTRIRGRYSNGIGDKHEIPWQPVGDNTATKMRVGVLINVDACNQFPCKK